MGITLLAFGVVFLAEFGDKTQILTLTLAARYGPWPVLAGVTLTTMVINAASVTVGAALADAIPARVVTILAGLAFIGFGLWSGRRDIQHADVRGRPTAAVVVLRTAGFFAISEVGDKTMLATIALAAHTTALPVWIGSTLGIVTAETIAVLVGSHLSRRIPGKIVELASTAAFIGIGCVLLLRAAFLVR